MTSMQGDETSYEHVRSTGSGHNLGRAKINVGPIWHPLYAYTESFQFW